MFEDKTTAELAEMLAENPKLKKDIFITMELLEAFRELSPEGQKEVFRFLEDEGLQELADILRTVATKTTSCHEDDIPDEELDEMLDTLLLVEDGDKRELYGEDEDGFYLMAEDEVKGE